MKKWLIEKLGGVSVSDYVGDIENVAKAANVLIEVQDSQISKLKAGKAEMEEAGKAMSECISELINKLNEERKVSNGLMAKGTALGIKVSELQDELERKKQRTEPNESAITGRLAKQTRFRATKRDCTAKRGIGVTETKQV